MTPKMYPHNLHTQNNIHFLKPPKNFDIQNFEPRKKWPSLRMYQNVRVPPPPPPPGILPVGQLLVFIFVVLCVGLWSSMRGSRKLC